MTRQEREQGRLRIIAFIVITALILIGIKLYDSNKNRNLDEPKHVIAEAQAITEAPQEPLPTVAVQVPEPVVETQPEPVIESVAVVEEPIYVAQEYSLPVEEAKAYIYNKESRNCPTRWQGEHGDCPAYHGTPDDPNVGYGLCQATPGWKMASAGEDWATSYETQDRWCTEYANNRYGGWQGAYEEWIRKKWW